MSISQVINYFQGDLLKGTASLRLNDACTAGKQNDYPIPAGAVVQMLFPATPSGSVSIDSSTSVPAEFGGLTEVVITSADRGEISFTVIPSKGNNIKPSVKLAPQPINIIIKDSLGARLQTFEIYGSLSSSTPAGIVCMVRANP